MITRATRMMAATLFAMCLTPSMARAADDLQPKVKSVVDLAIQPIMARYHVPGMAVGVIAEGKPYVFYYGVASLTTRHPVTRDTLFEIGSITKTFTATLVCYAQANARLSLSDTVGSYITSLRGTAFGGLTLVDLGTHTPGGLPLQVPDGITTDSQLMQYFAAWHPTYAPGTYRTYNNLGIGTLGLIAAKSMGRDFTDLMEEVLFPALDMKNSYINVPTSRMSQYAQGYSKDGAPVRMTTGVLSLEAYGIKATATDMTRFLEANMNLLQLHPRLKRAIMATHTGYFQAGPMTQDLMWEQFPYPATLKSLLEGNSYAMIYDATPVKALIPPEGPRSDTWINKTGSTNGFGAYVAFVPQQRLGIVILANKNYPIEERVTAAYRILNTLSGNNGLRGGGGR